LPELPEVETVRKGLLQAVLNKKIKNVTIRNPKLRYLIPVDKLKQSVIGSSVIEIKRRAKYLLLNLDNNSTLIVHLGMSGKLLLIAQNEQLDKHDHVIFSLSADELRYRDPRRFGMMDIIKNSDIQNYKHFKHLGVEPLSDEFNFDYGLSKVGESQRPIKNTIVDASFIVGIGNIYANEALFKAKIHPSRPTNRLKKTEWNNLISSIKQVLQDAIKQGGTTLADEGFQNLLNMGGGFQINLQVYGRAGKSCNVCGETIDRIVQQGRSSFVCVNCQK